MRQITVRGLQSHYKKAAEGCNAVTSRSRTSSASEDTLYIVAYILWRNDQTISITIKYAPLSYRTGGNRKRSEQSMNAVPKSLETVFSIAICRQSGEKRQSKTLFLTILDLRSSIVLTFSIAAFQKCLLNIGLLNMQPNQFKTMATRNNLLSGYKRQCKNLFLMILDLRCR